jgi:hypothetical protein
MAQGNVFVNFPAVRDQDNRFVCLAKESRICAADDAV